VNLDFRSPHFPSKDYRFAVGLQGSGVTVLGQGDQNHHPLRPAWKSALSEYFRRDDKDHYDDLDLALGSFTHHPGRRDRFDSHNEYGLETEARPCTGFKIARIRDDQSDRARRKPLMREATRRAGVKIARQGIVRSPGLDEILKMAQFIQA
jgi:hypothetical protein